MKKHKKKISKIDFKYSIKKYTNRAWKRLLIFFFFIIILNTSYYLITGKNVIEKNIRALLYKAGIYTEEIKSVSIPSSDWYTTAGGSWNINKSAEWIEENKAMITIDLITKIKESEKDKDVIFVLDISGSMSGEKLDKVKKDATELTEYILSNSNNNVALITFDTTASIISGLTKNQDFIIDTINSLMDMGATNYSEALKNVNTIMQTYNYNPNREAIVLFLTDGYPNIDTPNQISEYKTLKEKYPYLLITGIQYEMGNDIIQEIKEISDSQYLASTENLNNVLFEAALQPETYEHFEITDIIDNEYFYIEDIDDIKIDKGNITLAQENNNQKIIWKFEDNNFNTGSTAKMTINVTLKDKHQYNNGFYPTNTKETINSKLSNNDEETINSNKTPVLKVGYKVTYDTNEPKECRLKTLTEEIHYAFETVNKNEDELSCPGYIFKGWEVEEQVTTINDDTFIMPPKDITIRGVWTSQNISKSMEGTVHEKATLWRKVKKEAENGLHGANILSSSINDPYKIYYYNNNTGNNVYFANSCWKIIRTTETGGVKILYNGKPTVGTTCENTDTSTIPKSIFNENNRSIADLGYMYNERIIPIDNKVNISYYIFTKMITGSNYTNFSDSYRKENGIYYLENKDGSAPISKNWKTDYDSLSGYYSCYYTSSLSCSELHYITGTDKNYGFMLTLSDNQDIEDVNKDLKIGASITKDSNGVYTLKDVTNLKLSDWYSNYKNFNGQYICGDYSKTTCTDPKIISPNSIERGIAYEELINNPEKGILYGNSFTFDGTNYHLVDTITSDVWTLTYNNLSNNHYTCLNKTGTCETLYYITNTTTNTKTYYELNNGQGINDLITNTIQSENTNKISSNAKKTLDEWYENNLLDYTNKIEDTVYCNNRELASLGNLNPNGGTTNSSYIYFKGEQSPSLTCPNIYDRFTVSKENGNGNLTYPIGLLTKKESQLVGTGVLGTSTIHWLMTPVGYSTGYKSGSIAYGQGGYIYSNSIYANQYVIPLISLKNDIGYIRGNGTPTNPYIIE